VKEPLSVTRLYLIRHGEAFCNVEPIIGGMNGDEGLTERGADQALRLRDRLQATREIDADVLIASTFPRARQTAEIIAPAIGLPIVFDDEVQEMRPGDADGISITQFRERYGLPDWDRDPAHPLAPNGESYITFMARVTKAMDRIVAEHEGKTVVIVCHGGVIDGSLGYFIGLPVVPRPPVQFDTHNTSITQWDRRQHGLDDPRWRLIRYNDDAHLRETPAGPSLDWGEIDEAATGASSTHRSSNAAI